MPFAAVHIDVPVAAVLIAWGLLLAVAAAALGGLAALARRQNKPPPAARRGRPTPEDCARLRAEAIELSAVAKAAQEKLAKAVVSAQSAGARLTEERQAREAAGRAFDAAQRAHNEVAAAFRAADADRLRTDDEDRQDREVSRAALAAYRRGDLSVDQLREVFRRTGGWDPIQEQREREVGLLRAEAARTHREYDAAGNAERLAARAATIAQVAAEALAEEAAVAAHEARGAQAFAAECARELRRGRGFLGRR